MIETLNKFTNFCSLESVIDFGQVQNKKRILSRQCVKFVINQVINTLWPVTKKVHITQKGDITCILGGPSGH